MSQLLPPEKLRQLEAEFAVLHQIFFRFHNQHRVAVWWKYLNMVHRKVRNIVSNMQHMETAKQIRKKEQLRAEALNTAAFLIRKGLFRKIFYEVNSVIALGQFINLAFVLLGSISAIHAILVEMDGLDEKLIARKLAKPAIWQPNDDVDDEIGQELDEAELALSRNSANHLDRLEQDQPRENKRTFQETEPLALDDMDSIFGAKPKKKKKVKDLSKKEKKKKKKSAMDDIFG